jgi:AcrR family transcriptional regulator
MVALEVRMEGLQLRADAARNVSRILGAAYSATSGAATAPTMEQVAEAAGVGIATVYRRFPTRADLLGAVLERRWEDTITSALDRALDEPDPRDGMRRAFEGAVRFVAEDRVMLNVLSELGLMTMDLARRFCEPVAEILDRGQRDGVFRLDLVPEDIPRFVSMLFGVLGSVDPDTDAWQRYLDLMLDLISATSRPLAPATPVHDHKPVLPPSRGRAARSRMTRAAAFQASPEDERRR